MRRHLAIFGSLILVGLVGVGAGSPTLAAGSGTVSTLIGGSGPGIGPDDVDSAHGVNVGADGLLYVTDSDNHRLQQIVLDSTGLPQSFRTIAGGNGTGPSANQLASPYTATTDANGVTYIADSSNNRIQRVTFDGNGDPVFTTVAGNSTISAGDTLSIPFGVALGPDGSLFIADTFGHRIRKVLFDGNGDATDISTVFGSGLGSGPNQLFSPYGLTVSPDGTLFVADTFNHRVQRVTFDGGGAVDTVVTVAGGNLQGDGANQLSSPIGLAVDTAGSLYIADAQNHRVQYVTFDPVGLPVAVETIAGGNLSGSADNQLSAPTGLAIGTNGTLYIADSGNSRIQQITFDDQAPTVALNTIGTVRVGDTIALMFACDDTGGSGVGSCTATNNGVPILAGSIFIPTVPGDYVIAVTAVDGSNNSTADTWTITVFGKRELTGPYANLTGYEGAIARMYMAAFNRDPDAEGYAYWLARRGSGFPLLAMADYFVTSPELRAEHGTIGDADFVELLYANVMGRPSDAEGRSYWLLQLQGVMTQAHVLLQFSDSSEFRSLSGSS